MTIFFKIIATRNEYNNIIILLFVAFHCIQTKDKFELFILPDSSPRPTAAAGRDIRSINKTKTTTTLTHTSIHLRHVLSVQLGLFYGIATVHCHIHHPPGNDVPGSRTAIAQQRIATFIALSLSLSLTSHGAVVVVVFRMAVRVPPLRPSPPPSPVLVDPNGSGIYSFWKAWWQHLRLKQCLVLALVGFVALQGTALARTDPAALAVRQQQQQSSQDRPQQQYQQQHQDLIQLAPSRNLTPIVKESPTGGNDSEAQHLSSLPPLPPASSIRPERQQEEHPTPTTAKGPRWRRRRRRKQAAREKPNEKTQPGGNQTTTLSPPTREADEIVAGGSSNANTTTGGSGAATTTTTKRQQDGTATTEGGADEARILLEYSSSNDAARTTATTTTTTTPGLHVVVSHCDAPMNWIWERLLQPPPLSNGTDDPANTTDDDRPVPWKSLTVFTKCRRPPVGPDDLPPRRLSASSLSEAPNSPVSPTPDLVQVVELPNVGRCDHSYAYWIDRYMAAFDDPADNNSQDFQRPKAPISLAGNSSIGGNSSGGNSTIKTAWLYHPQDIVMFVKDNDNSYRQKWENKIPWSSLRDRTWETGFACASKVYINGTVALDVAAKRVMGLFRSRGFYQRGGGNKDASVDEDGAPSFKSDYPTLQAWVDSMPIRGLRLGNNAPPIPNPKSSLKSDGKSLIDDDLFMPICYGGHFLATLERVEASPVTDWSALVRGLSRGDNIEEGHYMERMWAALLSPPIPQADQAALLQTKGLSVIRRKSFQGLVEIKILTK